MHPILIFRHVECEGPGYLADFLDIHDMPYRLVCIDKGDAVPDSLDKVSALVFMGGPMSVNDPLPWIAGEIALIQAAHEMDLPMLGHCLGGQLLSKALGGRIGANPVTEIGWLPVTRINNSAADSWLPGLGDKFEVFHWHGETFSIPDEAEVILKSTHCENQAFVIGKTLAMQCHVEMSAELVIEWAELYAEQLRSPSETIQSKVQILENIDEKVLQLQLVAGIIYERWLEGFS